MKEAHQEALKIFNKLKPNPRNPRKISAERLALVKKSIENFSKMLRHRSIVYDKDFIVIGGNQRLLALKELVKEGFQLLPEYFDCADDFTEAEKKQFIVRDNVPDGEWEWEILTQDWQAEDLEAWGISGDEIKVKFGLNEADDEYIDENRTKVLTVEPPEAPRLKERLAFYCNNIDDYNRIKEAFEKSNNELDTVKLLEMI